MLPAYVILLDLEGSEILTLDESIFYSISYKIDGKYASGVVARRVTAGILGCFGVIFLSTFIV